MSKSTEKRIIFTTATTEHLNLVKLIEYNKSHVTEHIIGKSSIVRFNDGEFEVSVLPEVEGKECIILHSIVNPSNENLILLVMLADALANAGAKFIHAVIPYFGYARADKQKSNKHANSIRVICGILNQSPINKYTTLDIHNNKILDNLYAEINMLSPINLFYSYIKKNYVNSDNNILIVSPDAGGEKNAQLLAKSLGVECLVLKKTRNKYNKVSIESLKEIADLVDNKICIIVDDIVDSAGTLCIASDVLSSAGAREISCLVTHALLSGNALEKIQLSQIKRLTVTNSIHQRNIALPSFIEVIDISNQSLI